MGMMGVYMLADEATMNRLTEDDDLFEAVEDYGDEDSTESYGIDKLWDGLHFLLTGVSAQEPIEGNKLSEAIVGIFVFDCDEFIAYTDPGNIGAIVKAIDEVNIEVLVQKMNVSAFKKAKIYPNIWVKENEENLKKELKTEFLNLRSFYKKALDLKTGVLVSIY